MNNPSRGFNKIQAGQLEDALNIQMVMGALNLDTTEFKDAFTAYNKVLAKVKNQVRREIEKIETVETALYDLKIKVR